MGSERVPRFEGAAGSAETKLWRGQGTGPLAGVRVVDFGQYLAGPLLAMLFADQGAEVLRVDPPGGPRWETPINAVLLRGRRHVILDLHDERDRARAQALVGSADIVIENFRPGVTDRLGIGPGACLGRFPRLIYCSLPGFGAGDPRADVAAWEGVVMAAGGAYSLPPISAYSLPQSAHAVFSALPLASVYAALEGAVAVVGALLARDRDGVGQHVEVPLYDALFEASNPMTFERNSPSVGDVVNALAWGWYRCADGRYIYIGSAWFRHTEWFVRAAGCEAWIDEGLVEYEHLMHDAAAVQELRSRFVALFARRPAREWEALGRAHGCSLAVVNSLMDWLAEPHALASGTLVDTDDPQLGRMVAPGRAVRASTAPDGGADPRRAPGADNAEVLPVLDRAVSEGLPAPGPAPAPGSSPPPLAGVRVLDFTRVAAAPTATKLLAQLGADVIKVDTDPTNRAVVPEPIGHYSVNRGKRSLRLDLHDPADRQVLPALLATADVIVQNFSLGVDQRLGIDEASARQYAPSIVYTYFNAFGATGPWAEARGYAELVNCATGISERTLGERPFPSGSSAVAFDLPRWTFTDYAGGVLGAFAAMLGLYERSRTGRGPFLETSLARVTTLLQIVYLLDYQGRDINEPRGDAPGWSALQRLYDTADGAVFVGALVSQTGALLDTVGAENIEDLPNAFADRAAADICENLRALDIGAHTVEKVADLMAPDGMAAQRGLRCEEHSEEFGRVVTVGPVARLSGTPLVASRMPRPFGAESEDIRQELGVETGRLGG
jgi:crotonobetainyl-CoA:carnitine CoA-transferase CaiB-like acyl-CoA transferase